MTTAESFQRYLRGDHSTPAATPSTKTSVKTDTTMAETSSKKKVFKAVLETYEEGPNQTYGSIRDRVTLESFGCELAEIKEMRKPFAAAQEALNQGDDE